MSEHPDAHSPKNAGSVTDAQPIPAPDIAAPAATASSDARPADTSLVQTESPGSPVRNGAVDVVGGAVGTDADSDARSNPRRRRGSRGGRNRKRPPSVDGPDTDRYVDEGADTDGADDGVALESVERDVASDRDRRPDDMPDHPREGVPSAEAAARATVRPRIGDTRPAPQPDGDGHPNAAEGAVGGQEPQAGPRRNRDGERRPRGERVERGERAETGRQGRARTGGSGSPRSSSTEAVAPESGTSSDAMVDDGPERTAEGRRRGRGGRPRDVASSPQRLVDPATLDDETIEKRRGKERNGRPLGRYLMAVHVHPKATQIAVLEGRALIEHYVSRPADSVSQIHGNIYFGRVQNVLPGMEAAFVDIGTPKNAVLYRGDLQFDTSELEGNAGNAGGGKRRGQSDLRIEQLLKNGQTLVSQVTKNPIGSKGARLTQEVSIPGRFVVLVPNSDTYGISKRLADDERKRLRRILDEVRPEGHGLIVRTAAEGATPDELRRDVELLMRQWTAIEAKAKKAKGPVLLYREPDMAVRVIREEFNRNYRGVVIDDRALYEEVRDYVESITPELADRVEYYDPAVEALPLFEKHHVHEQLHKAIDRKVWLPSGGSLIIERTEALTVIDVNTGKNVGSSSLEETVFRNNLEAAEEIARQLRLRDIGGIIVIDFIDMEIRANRAAVVEKFRDSLARDKTRTQVFDISELGLVEMTRKRIGEGLVESLSDWCPSCGGRGFVFDPELTG